MSSHPDRLIDGMPMSDINELRQYLMCDASPGDVMTVQVGRGGAVIDVQVTLGSKADFE